jgi:hypothetical protein
MTDTCCPAEKRQQSGAAGQPVQSGVPIYQAAMTDKDGNVVAYDANNVYMSGVADGL